MVNGLQQPEVSPQNRGAASPSYWRTLCGVRKDWCSSRQMPGQGSVACQAAVSVCWGNKGWPAASSPPPHNYWRTICKFWKTTFSPVTVQLLKASFHGKWVAGVKVTGQMLILVSCEDSKNIDSFIWIVVIKPWLIPWTLAWWALQARPGEQWSFAENFQELLAVLSLLLVAPCVKWNQGKAWKSWPGSHPTLITSTSNNLRLIYTK